MRLQLNSIAAAVVPPLACLALASCGGAGSSSAVVDDTSTFSDGKPSRAGVLAVSVATTPYEAEGGTFGEGARLQAASNAFGGQAVGLLIDVGAYTQVIASSAS